MPQLNLETFVTQYFWLIIFLFTTYLFSATLYLPKFAEIFKVRSFLDTIDTLLLDSPFSLKSKSLLSLAFLKSVSNPVPVKYDSTFLNINNDWSNSVK